MPKLTKFKQIFWSAFYFARSTVFVVKGLGILHGCGQVRAGMMICQSLFAEVQPGGAVGAMCSPENSLVLECFLPAFDLWAQIKAAPWIVGAREGLYKASFGVLDSHQKLARLNSTALRTAPYVLDHSSSEARAASSSPSSS